ncbi:hypothetical protein PUN28_007351 [Cardiocondyla obscurior]|uniref:Uncharacterized protein n=1 Tax=Cardiocondyla obscurior TaxID=286306 RepID=A0AAW2G4R9_9HYME
MSGGGERLRAAAERYLNPSTDWSNAKKHRFCFTLLGDNVELERLCRNASGKKRQLKRNFPCGERRAETDDCHCQVPPSPSPTSRSAFDHPSRLRAISEGCDCNTTL